MEQVKNEALEALAACLYEGQSSDGHRIMREAIAPIVMGRLAKHGFTIAPIAQPVADEKLREAVEYWEPHATEGSNDYIQWKVIKAALAELAELRAERKWRPIETAPRDGKIIIGFAVMDTDTGIWQQRLISWNQYHEEPHWVDWPKWSAQPTHWMSLPAPPATGGV